MILETVPYDIREGTTLHCRDAGTVLYGSETRSSLGPKTLETVPYDLRDNTIWS